MIAVEILRVGSTSVDLPLAGFLLVLLILVCWLIV